MERFEQWMVCAAGSMGNHGVKRIGQVDSGTDRCDSHDSAFEAAIG